jgi:MinD-like ATPase involved in chromosome partitioning or flagellar assembly
MPFSEIFGEGTCPVVVTTPAVPSCSDASTMAAVLERLKFRYRTLVNELADIHGKHPLNGPEVKTADGGTTLEVTKKIKQLEESIKATREAIKAHLELTAELEAGDVAPWTFETQLEL